MIPLDSLLIFASTSLLLALTPGPDNLFVLSQSALFGRRAGITITLGLCTGLIVHTGAVALGAAAIFQTSESAFTALKLAGAGYLIYLAWQSFRAAAQQSLTGATVALITTAQYRRGVVMNLTNPKVSLFFLAFLPQFTSPQYGPLAPQIMVLGGVFMMSALSVFITIATLAGTVSQWWSRSQRAQIVLHRIAGLVFIALAVHLIVSDHAI